ncbi:hypothetical protein CANMA_005417 [Candida margitis]|uniref:uncharacterized protein n=1 Tax=Candida margitis TaxID=1775924 RepID=UPI002226A214|nr:uncharacterized protein CANMA_005417 [Candida margitis]KAI5949837.1 hypothetical protein CANMA_005417 [Candida margitis]
MEHTSKLYDYLNLKIYIDNLLKRYKAGEYMGTIQFSSNRLKWKDIRDFVNEDLAPSQENRRTKQLIKNAFEHRLCRLNAEEKKCFLKLLMELVQSSNPSAGSFEKPLSEPMIGLITEFLSSIHAYCRANNNSTITYDTWLQNLVNFQHCSYFKLSYFEVSTNKGATKNILGEESDIFHFDETTVDEIELSSFRHLSHISAFTIPSYNMGSKEVHLSITLSHWLDPLINYLGGTIEQESTIHQIETEQPTKYSVPLCGTIR